jgi:2-hydroxychromene-2-carboxylate isomerase
MVMTDVRFLFDFGSPNAYLSHKVIPQIERRTGARFEYVPVLLGGLFKLTGNRSPAEAFAGIKNKLAYEGLETRRFVQRHGITGFTSNPYFPVNTLRIMRGAVAAQRLGVFVAYVDAVFHHMWEAPKKMDEPEVIAAALTESGLDAQALMTMAEDPGVKQALIDNTNAAFEAGAFGSPSFLVGGELWFGKDRLRDVEEAIAAAA